MTAKDEIEEVWQTVCLQFPGYVLTKPVTKAAMLATLRAIREPSAATLEIGCTAYAKDFGRNPHAAVRALAEDVIVASRPLAAAFHAMLDAKIAEIEATE